MKYYVQGNRTDLIAYVNLVEIMSLSQLSEDLVANKMSIITITK